MHRFCSCKNKIVVAKYTFAKYTFATANLALLIATLAAVAEQWYTCAKYTFATANLSLFNCNTYCSC